jgi:DNA polymerase-1
MKLMILDGNSIVNRAFYGIRMLNAPDGTPTNGIYGFIAILQKLLEEEKPEALCVAFDLKGPTFRHQRYEAYKAQRKGMPEELAMQMPVLKEVLHAMGISMLELEGYEADDLIGTVSRICGEENWDCRVVTGDRDSFQLITQHTWIKHVKTRMGQTETIDYTPERFQEEYGFAPIHIVDLKALMGDASDNIPGVAGVGEKTALDLIRRYGDLKTIYENLEALEIKEGVRKKLQAGEEMARLSYELATIDTHVPMEFTPEGALWDKAYRPELYDLFKRLGFEKFIDRFGLTPGEGEAKGVPTPSNRNFITVESEEQVVSLLHKISESDIIAVYPRDGLDVLEICTDGDVYTVHWSHAGDTYQKLLHSVFCPETRKISHNIKDLMGLLLEEGLSTEGFVFDTALAAYLIEATENRYELERISQKYLNRSCSGAEAIWDLYPVLSAQLEELNMEALFKEIELPLCVVLAEMERTGFAVDKQALYQFGEDLTTGIDALQQEIWSLAGEEFNINSPKQLGTILFDRLMLPAGKKTKTGWSTNADVLEKLRDKHPIVNKILEYRMLTKLKSTYAEGLLKVIAPDGRIHTSFQMTVTATGRLSSTEPNLQNIPVRRELGAQIRRMFVAEKGKVLVDADYSQIELRILAHISQDKRMIEAFLYGKDIHRATAAQIFGLSPEEVTPLMRSRAKAVNFGIVYGISAFSLAQDIGVYQNEAKAYIDAYLEKYDGVHRYMREIVEQAKKQGYVATLYGRRRNLPELQSSNHNLRSFGERVALNMPIQGTAADIMKLAMVRVYRRLKKENLQAKLLLQVHDELIVECPEEEGAQVAQLLEEEMEQVVQFSVPMLAEAHSGRNWAEAKG